MEIYKESRRFRLMSAIGSNAMLYLIENIDHLKFAKSQLKDFQAVGGINGEGESSRPN